MKGKYIILAALVTLVLFGMLSCQPSGQVTPEEIHRRYLFHSWVYCKELVGDKATVTVSIPNGLDPHEWEPSAKDIETINKADLVIENGLGLEGGMEKTLEAAKSKGVKFFTASDYITVRHVGPGEGIPSGDPDQAIGAPDPHLWMDPITMKSVVSALAPELMKDLNLDVTAQATDLENQLDSFEHRGC